MEDNLVEMISHFYSFMLEVLCCSGLQGMNLSFGNYPAGPYCSEMTASHSLLQSSQRDGQVSQPGQKECTVSRWGQFL